MLCRNVGPVDRAARAIVGLILISFVFVGPVSWLGWIGLIPLATAFLGFCPAYTFAGIDTGGTCGPVDLTAPPADHHHGH
jgi:hypothetical protein